MDSRLRFFVDAMVLAVSHLLLMFIVSLTATCNIHVSRRMALNVARYRPGNRRSHRRRCAVPDRFRFIVDFPETGPRYELTGPASSQLFKREASTRRVGGVANIGARGLVGRADETRPIESRPARSREGAGCGKRSAGRELVAPSTGGIAPPAPAPAPRRSSRGTGFQPVSWCAAGDQDRAAMSFSTGNARAFVRPFVPCFSRNGVRLHGNANRR